MGKAE